jgi:hypothetical protein
MSDLARKFQISLISIANSLGQKKSAETDAVNF